MDRVALFLDWLTIPQLFVLGVALAVIGVAGVVELWNVVERRVRRWRTRRYVARSTPRPVGLPDARRASLDLAVRLDGTVGRMPRMPDHDTRVDRRRRIIH